MIPSGMVERYEFSRDYYYPAEAHPRNGGANCCRPRADCGADRARSEPIGCTRIGRARGCPESSRHSGAGHRSFHTVSALIEALGGPHMPMICETVYDEMFILVPTSAKPAVVRIALWRSQFQEGLQMNDGANKR